MLFVRRQKRRNKSMATKLHKNSEFVCLLEDGSVSDFWLHEAILAGGEAASSKRAVADAIRRGMSGGG
jgi:hypothetical protein